MSSKMSSKRQIKRTKEKRSQDKMDKAMSDVKKIGIVSCCLIGILIVIGIFISPKESYAAGFLTEVPDKFISEADRGDGTSRPPLGHELISGINLPWEFAGYIPVTDESGEYITDVSKDDIYNDENKISFIYCVDKKKEMANNLLYSKGDSVKNQISLEQDDTTTSSYPGLIYILLHDNIVETYGLQPTGYETTETMNYYLAQVAIWCYIDEVRGDYNFTAEQRATIYADPTYGKIINDLVLGAKEYQSYSTLESYITVDESNISYSIIGDYIETSVITPIGSNSYFENYSVQADDSTSNIEILDANGNPVTGLINANEGFKVRIPVSATQNNDFNLPITIVGYFSNNYDAYVYIPDNSEAQRALLGKLERVSTPTTFYLKAPTLNVPDTASTSYLVYGIGALIIIAGIVLIVVAKRPKNAKKK